MRGFFSFVLVGGNGTFWHDKLVGDEWKHVASFARGQLRRSKAQLGGRSATLEALDRDEGRHDSRRTSAVDGIFAN